MNNNTSFKTMLERIDRENKGYIFDSLVFRYQLARSAEMRAAIDEKIKEARMTGKDPLDIKRTERNRYERDLMRFIEILNRAIGEHE